MENWKSALKADAIAWLLEQNNPSVRYFTLVKLLDRPEDDAQVVATREAINESEPVQKMLEAQRPQGYWGHDKRPYHGVSKQLITLEHLGYQGDDEHVPKAIEYLFANAQMEDGAFTSDIETERRGVIPCFTANAVHFLYWFGYGEDERTRKALDYLLRTQRDDDGWLCFERVKKTHACFWATAKVLRAFEILPPEQQTTEIQEARRRAINLFLNNGLYKHHSEFGNMPTGSSSVAPSSPAPIYWKSWSLSHLTYPPTMSGYKRACKLCWRSRMSKAAGRRRGRSALARRGRFSLRKKASPANG